MPRAMERRLQREARQKFPGDERRQDAYVYGTMRRVTGWRPGKSGKRAKRRNARRERGRA